MRCPPPTSPTTTKLEGTNNMKIRKNFREEVLIFKMHTSSKNSKRNSESSQKSKLILAQNPSFSQRALDSTDADQRCLPQPRRPPEEDGGGGTRACVKTPGPRGPPGPALSLHRRHPSASLAVATPSQRPRMFLLRVRGNSSCCGLELA